MIKVECSILYFENTGCPKPLKELFVDELLDLCLHTQRVSDTARLSITNFPFSHLFLTLDLHRFFALNFSLFTNFLCADTLRVCRHKNCPKHSLGELFRTALKLVIS
jgi:hypothetical protein